MQECHAGLCQVISPKPLPFVSQVFFTYLSFFLTLRAVTASAFTVSTAEPHPRRNMVSLPICSSKYLGVENQGLPSV